MQNKIHDFSYLFNTGLCLRWATNCIKRCPTVSKGTGVCSCSCSRWQRSKVGWKAGWDEKRERKGRPLKIVKTGIKAQTLQAHSSSKKGTVLRLFIHMESVGDSCAEGKERKLCTDTPRCVKWAWLLEFESLWNCLTQTLEGDSFTHWSSSYFI